MSLCAGRVRQVSAACPRTARGHRARRPGAARIHARDV